MEVNSLTFDRPRVPVQNFSFLACLEVVEKFVVVVGWGGVVVGWSRPSLGFSFSQAEQFKKSRLSSDSR